MPDMKHKIDEETLNKIIAAAYKDAGLIDRFNIYLLTKKNPEIKNIFIEYRKTAENIKSIKLDKCPDSVIESIKTQSYTEKKLFGLRPAYAFVVSLILVAIAVFILMNQNEEKEAVYTKAEIELAEEQVKASLAIVSKVFKKTENLIQEEVLPKRVGKPIHKSLKIINEVLIGG